MDAGASYDHQTGGKEVTTQPRKTASEWAKSCLRENCIERYPDLVDSIEKALESYLLQESGELEQALEKSYKWLNHYINVNRSHPHPKDFDMGLAYIRETLNNFRSRHK